MRQVTHAWFAGLVALAIAGAAPPYADLLTRPLLSPDQQKSMMYSYVERNLPVIEFPQTRQEWEARRVALRHQILGLVGLDDLDRRTPVRFVERGRIERDGYRIEKILYESYPGMMVPALVYVPGNLSAAAPAMVSIPGHTYCEGKAAAYLQARNVNLVRRGLIVLSYDYINTGERNTGVNACATMPYGGGNDHGQTAFSYTAGTPTALEVLDGVRAIDYLYTRRDVDRTRVGFTGESGGSNSTYWVSALDDRVKLSVPVCSVTTFDYWIRNDRNWDWHQRPNGIRRIAEIPTLLALFAPKPMLVIGALRGTDSEEFPFDETEKAVVAARRVYRLYGAGGALEIRESSTSHGYQEDKRERLYSFVERHFLGRGKETSRELPANIETLRDLAVGIPAGNRTLAGIYAEWFAKPTPVPALPEGAAAANTLARAMRSQLASLLGLPDSAPEGRSSFRYVASRADVLIRQLAVEPEEGISLPAVEVRSRTASPHGLVVIPGRSAEMAEAVPPMISAGLAVWLVDLRGAGEISSGGRRTDNWAWFVGRPWPGMWAWDLRAVAAAASAEHPSLPVSIFAGGRFATAALFAAALDRRIAAVAVQLTAPSYRAEAASGAVAEVPRVLATTDLPQVTAMLAPRPCLIQHPPPAAAAFRGPYSWALQVYRQGFSSSALELRPANSNWKESADWLGQALRR